MPRQPIYTITANCQDCYRCVRECPVKAIRISGGQAQIDEELCITCGICVRECPQNAKTVRNDLNQAKELVNSKRMVAASVAPSFAAVFPGPLSRRLPSALRRLGFRFVCETAEGAKYITEKSFAHSGTGGITTACPVVVSLVEKYYPDYIDALIPVVSPMIAHGKMLKEKYPECAVVFIGPCAAKKHELLAEENKGAIDVAITFAELGEWLAAEGFLLEHCIESDFDNFYQIGDARLFPIQGGMLKTGAVANDGTQTDVLHVSGADEVIDLFKGSFSFENKMVEPLFCKGGCINTPCIEDLYAREKVGNLYTRRENLIRYANAAKRKESNLPAVEVCHNMSYVNRKHAEAKVPTAQIQKILESTGKVDKVYQLNCGACGYKTCYECATAIARGMAEAEMCIPYMRRLAQQRTDRILDTTPNGVVILDSELLMTKMNPAFQKMFMCNNGILGRRISYLINAQGFELLQSGAMEKYESVQTKYGIKYLEKVYALREDKQYVGIYTNITDIKYDINQLDAIKAQTLTHAREFLDHQLRFAQEMAHYLGKSTAQSEEIAMRLIALYERDGGEAP